MPFDDVDPESLLSRFAYKSTEHHVQSLPSEHEAPPAPSRLPTTVFSKDPQLTQLTKCVCCGLRWTSSKSVKQKRTHIDQCAKKNALTKETIRILIEKETSAAQSTDPSTCAPPKDATLMDSVVPAGPVKKVKRQHVISTIRSLPETRVSILDKAKDILGPASTKAPADPQPTQQFTQSALACRNPKRPALFHVNECTEEPPPTQPFGASLLQRGGMATTEHATDSCDCGQPVSSMFAQDSILSSDRNKRPASPPHLGNDSRTVRRRLQ